MNQTLQKAINSFGNQKQLLKCAEECNELARALVRYVAGIEAKDEVFREIVDVEEITLPQVKEIMGYDSFDTVAEREKKISKLERTIALKGGDNNAGP